MSEHSRVEAMGTLTVSDLRRFAYFHFLRRIWPVYVLSAVIVLLCIAGIVPMALIWPAAIQILVLGGLLALNDYSARKAFRTQIVLREPMHYSFTDESIQMDARSANSRIDWSVVIEVRETRSLLCIYQASCAASVIPKRFFHSDAGLQTWKQLVISKMGSKRYREPGFIARHC